MGVGVVVKTCKRLISLLTASLELLEQPPGIINKRSDARCESSKWIENISHEDQMVWVTH